MSVFFGGGAHHPQSLGAATEDELRQLLHGQHHEEPLQYPMGVPSEPLPHGGGGEDSRHRQGSHGKIALFDGGGEGGEGGIPESSSFASTRSFSMSMHALAMQQRSAGRLPSILSPWQRVVSVFGPGLVVMLADTDAGCLITAAQTGASWGYSIIWLQLVMIPLVYMAQELAVRLGVYTGMGHGELITREFGAAWAWLSVITMVVTCTGAVISEMTGIVGVGRLLGIPDIVSASAAALTLIAIVFTGKYRQVEIAALVMGMFEFTYFITMVKAFRWSDFRDSFFRFSFQDSNYCFLLAANIGAVIMPWMIFYQQSAVVDKQLRPIHLSYARQDTAIGAVLTQAIMSSVIITTAGSIWRHTGRQFPNPNPPTQIGEFSTAISEHISYGELLFCVGMIGGSMIGAVVVSLTAAWGLGEVAGYKRSLEHSPRDAPWFYAVFGGCVLCGMVCSLCIDNLVFLNVAIQVMNACLLPIVLGFLFILAVRVLPEESRLKGPYMWFSAVAYTLAAGVGVVGGLYGAIFLQ